MPLLVNTSFACLTEYEIATDAVTADAMELWSDKEQKPTIKKKCLSSAGDGTDAVINNVGSSTNQESQEYYKHFVRKIPTKEKQQRSWILTVSANLNYYTQKKSTTSKSSTDK
jgi:hypothetical protein